MAWLVRCKNCLAQFSVTKDCFQSNKPQNDSELALTCDQCGWIGEYQGRDLQLVIADAMMPFGPRQSSAAD